jgi:hypothetical protein
MTRREIAERLESIALMDSPNVPEKVLSAFLVAEIRRMVRELRAEADAEGAAARLAADDRLGARNWAADRLADMIDLGPPPGFPFRPATTADLKALALGG